MSDKRVSFDVDEIETWLIHETTLGVEECVQMAEILDGYTFAQLDEISKMIHHLSKGKSG